MLEKLEPRERLMLTGLLVFLVLILLGFIVSRIVNFRQDKNETAELYRGHVGRMARIRNTLQNLPPAPKLPDKTEMAEKAEALARKQNLQSPDIKSDNIRTVKYERVEVKIRFHGEPLQNILKFVHEVEFGNSLHARVGEFDFSRAVSAKEVYDASLTLYVQKPIVKKNKRRGSGTK